jgi:hypothetical protein
MAKVVGAHRPAPILTEHRCVWARFSGLLFPGAIATDPDNTEKGWRKEVGDGNVQYCVHWLPLQAGEGYSWVRKSLKLCNCLEGTHFAVTSLKVKNAWSGDREGRVAVSIARK